MAERRINPNSLLGLMWRLRANSEKLDNRIKGLEKKLRKHGIFTPLPTSRDVVTLLGQRQAKGHTRFMA